MKTKTCPYCKEKILCDAIVCRYCRRDLPEPATEKTSSLGWVAALITTALLVGTSAILVVDYLKEREHWLKDQSTKSSDE